jgi:Bacterial PH domain
LFSAGGGFPAGAERRFWGRPACQDTSDIVAQEGIVTRPIPADRSADRFRLPVQPPIRHLVIASLCATVGSLEVILWAAFRLPGFVLAAGIVLIAVGLGYALTSLIRYRRLRWVAYVGSGGLTVVSRSRRRVVPWAEIDTVRLVNSRLEIRSPDGRRSINLAVDRTRPAHVAAAEIVRAINAGLSARP